MFKEGLVSVIIPVYNAGKFIEETILTAERQTYSKIEIVIVDDCSTDNSIEIIKGLAKTYNNIFLYENETNSGAGVSRNKAILKSTGQYVAFLDSDDLWVADKIEKQVNDLKNHDGAFSYGAINMISEDGSIKKGKRKIKSKVTYKYLLKNTVIATSTVLVDRNKIGAFEMSKRRGGQDYATWLSLLKKCGVAYGINEVLCSYRTGRKDSLAGNKWKSIKQVWQIQTQDERINKFSSFINLMFFIFNALKKYLF